MSYFVTKTYGHDLGLSACFRQWCAKSHCRFLHGYPLSFKLTFQATTLDENNWVLDFGGLKPLKQWLCDTFDHKLLIAEDDPCRSILEQLGQEDSSDPIGAQLAQVKVIPFVGCEGFAVYVAGFVSSWIKAEHAHDYNNRGLRLVEVEVREHGGNSAIYRNS